MDADIAYLELKLTTCAPEEREGLEKRLTLLRDAARPRLPNIKDCVLGDDKRCTFVRFADDTLWYRCTNGFEFPVSVEEAKGGIFLPEDKASFFMRWIRKHLDFLNRALETENPPK